MMRIIILSFLLFLVCMPGSVVPAGKEQKKQSGSEISKQDMEIIKAMEILKLLELIENMDLLKDMDIIIEEGHEDKN